MRTLIYLSGNITGSDADILNDTRLSSIPYGGALTIVYQANLSTAAAHFVATIQLPDGSVPVDAQRVFAGQDVEGAFGGQLDTRFMQQFTFPAAQGGHFTIAFTEAAGAAILTWAVMLKP